MNSWISYSTASVPEREDTNEEMHGMGGRAGDRGAGVRGRSDGGRPADGGGHGSGGADAERGVRAGDQAQRTTRDPVGSHRAGEGGLPRDPRRRSSARQVEPVDDP